MTESAAEAKVEIRNARIGAATIRIVGSHENYLELGLNLLWIDDDNRSVNGRYVIKESDVGVTGFTKCLLFALNIASAEEWSELDDGRHFVRVKVRGREVIAIGELIGATDGIGWSDTYIPTFCSTQGE